MERNVVNYCSAKTNIFINKIKVIFKHTEIGWTSLQANGTLTE